MRKLREEESDLENYLFRLCELLYAHPLEALGEDLTTRDEKQVHLRVQRARVFGWLGCHQWSSY